MALTQEQMKELDKEIIDKAQKKALKQTAQYGTKKFFGVLSPVLPTSRQGLAPMQSAPQTILGKEQRMLQAMFNSKNQLWGTNDVVRINNTLTSGQGLIKTGDGDSTRRLFLP